MVFGGSRSGCFFEKGVADREEGLCVFIAVPVVDVVLREGLLGRCQCDYPGARRLIP